MTGACGAGTCCCAGYVAGVRNGGAEYAVGVWNDGAGYDAVGCVICDGIGCAGIDSVAGTT